MVKEREFVEFTFFCYHKIWRSAKKVLLLHLETKPKQITLHLLSIK